MSNNLWLVRSPIAGAVLKKLNDLASVHPFIIIFSFLEMPQLGNKEKQKSTMFFPGSPWDPTLSQQRAKMGSSG